jgi:hypothetical protein
VVGILLPDGGVVPGRARLVVADDQGAVVGHVDPVGAAAETDHPPVGQAHLDRLGPAALAELELAASLRASLGTPDLLVLVEHLHQVVEHAGAVARPDRRVPGDTAGLRLVGDLLADRAQRLALAVGPRLVGGGHSVVLDEPGEEPVERLVQQLAALERAHLEQLLRLLDGLDPQDALDEVAVRAPGPRLQRRRGDHRPAVGRVGQGAGVAGEVAVEACERLASPGPDELGGALQRDVTGHRIVAVVGCDGPKPPLLLGGRRVGAGQRGGVGRRRVDGGHAPAVALPLGRRELGSAGQCAQGREQPAAGQAVAAAPQVASREARHDVRRGGERGEQVPVHAVDPLAHGWELAAGADPGLVGQQRVLVVAPRAQVLGQPDDEHQVGVEPDRGGQRGDEHAGAEPAHALQVLGQLQLDRLAQRGEVGGVLDGVETGQAAQQQLDAPAGHPFLLGQLTMLLLGPEHAVEGVERPPCQLAPGLRRGAERDALAQPGDEGQQLLGGRGLALEPLDQPLARAFRVVLLVARAGPLLGGIAGEPGRPVVGADDPRQPGHPLPPRRGNPPAGRVAHRSAGEQAEHGRPAPAVVGQREQVGEPAGQHAFGGRANTRAVDHDARCGELLVQQPGVGRRARVEQCDAVGRCGAQRGHHLPHDTADLVVGVGCVQHPARRRGGRVGRRRQGKTEPLEGAQHPGVRPRVSRDPGDHGHRRGGREGCRQGGGAAVEVLRQEKHHGAQRVEASGGPGEQLARRGAQVVHVVPVPLQARDDPPVQGHQVARQRPGAGHGVERGGGQVAQRPVRGHQRGDGGGVPGHRSEAGRVGRQLSPPRGGQHRTRRRTPAGGVQRRRGEQLGDPVERQHGQAGDAAPARVGGGAGQGPARDDAAEVGRHDQRDGRQRITVLGLVDGAAQLVVDAGAVRRPAHRPPGCNLPHATAP